MDAGPRHLEPSSLAGSWIIDHCPSPVIRMGPTSASSNLSTAADQVLIAASRLSLVKESLKERTRKSIVFAVTKDQVYDVSLVRNLLFIGGLKYKTSDPTNIRKCWR